MSQNIMLPGTVATVGTPRFCGYVPNVFIRTCDSMSAVNKLRQSIDEVPDGKHNKPCVPKHVQRCSKQS